MRCPFPDCATQKNSATNNPPAAIDHVADDVYLCRTCGRLAFKCVADDCRLALNRPFSCYCRRCGKSQFPSIGPTAFQRWSEVQRFDFDWKFSKPPAHGELTHGELLASEQSSLYYLDEIKGFRSPKVLIEMGFIDGLLAIHQGGGFLALVHPFGDHVENPELVSRIAWTRPEEELVKRPYARDDDADVFRPFSPIATSDRKYVLFSTPYAVIAVQLGSLPGWNSRTETQVTVVWSAESREEIRLAAPPILLKRTSVVSHNGSPGAPDLIGLLLYDPSSSSYFWQMVKLDAMARTENPTERNQGLHPVSITGHPVQVLQFRDQCFVLATPAGHWLWSMEDACQGNASTIYPLSCNHDASKIILNAEVTDRSVFSWRYQHLLQDQVHESNRRRDESRNLLFELCYMRTLKGGVNTVEQRNVWPKNAGATQSAIPQAIHFYGKAARAVGDCVSVDDSDAREMLFLVDSAGLLYRRPITGDDPTPVRNIQIGQLTKIFGFQFFDPLLVVVCEDSTHDTLQRIELRSFRQPELTATAGQISLKADPLPWSDYLFTCESKAGRVVVVRRRYSVERVAGQG